MRSGSNTWIPSNMASRIISSSATADYLVKVGGTTVGHGFTCRDVSFIVNPAVNTALTKCLYIDSMDCAIVKSCGFGVSDNATFIDATAIYLESSAGDCSWLRINGNWISKMQTMVFAKTPGGTNFNREVVRDNFSYYNGGSTGLIPQFDLAGDVADSTFECNNVETSGAMSAIGFVIRTGGYSNNNVFINNCGEKGNDTDPFYWVEANRFGNIFIGGQCTAGTGMNGIWLQVDNGTGINQVIGDFDYVGTVGYRRRIVDSHVGANTKYATQVWLTKTGMPVKYKDGAGTQTISDADWIIAPPNGTLAVTCNTTSGEQNLWKRANVAWTKGGISTDPIWAAKGDLAVGTGAGTAAILAPGSNGLFLQAASGEATGLKYAAVPTGNVTSVVRAEDSGSKTSDTTLADDDTLKFATGGNSTDIWLVEATLIVNTANSTMDCKFGWSYPTGATAYWGGDSGMAVVSAFGAAAASSTPTALGAINKRDWACCSGTTQTIGIALRGVFFDGGTAGDITLQWAQNTSDAGAMYLRKGSNLRITKLA